MPFLIQPVEMLSSLNNLNSLNPRKFICLTACSVLTLFIKPDMNLLPSASLILSDNKGSALANLPGKLPVIYNQQV